MSIDLCADKPKWSFGVWDTADTNEHTHVRNLYGRVHRHAYRQVCTSNSCTDMRVDMCADMRVDMCVGMYVDVRVDVRVDMRVEMCVDM